MAVTTFGYYECCPKLQLTVKAGADDQKEYEEKKIVDLINDETTRVKFDVSSEEILSRIFYAFAFLNSLTYQRSLQRIYWKPKQLLNRINNVLFYCTRVPDIIQL